MINTNAFDYINVLDKAMDASWKRNEAIGNNIANASTPGYKRQDVEFEAVLKKALGANHYKSTDAKVAALRSSDLEGVPYIDHANLSYRLDGNNVDMETEQVMLVENQTKYEGLWTSMRQEFQNLQAVMK